jgi:hypothetical protein
MPDALASFARGYKRKPVRACWWGEKKNAGDVRARVFHVVL